MAAFSRSRLWWTWFVLIISVTCVRSCQETVLGNGYMNGDVIEEISESDSCSCCALCHRDSRCASLSYSNSQRRCKLHSAVAGYNTFTASNSFRYYVQAQRNLSGHDAFCFNHSNCITSGDRCNGHICTDDATVTCKDLQERYGRTTHGVYWGSVEDVTLRLYCYLSYRGGGWTWILTATSGDVWTEALALNRSMEAPSKEQAYSIYHLADAIAQSGSQGSYELDIYDQDNRGVTVLASSSLLTRAPVPIVSMERMYRGYKVDQQGSDTAVPWLASHQHARVYISMSPDIAVTDSGTIAGDSLTFRHNASPATRVLVMVKEI